MPNPELLRTAGYTLAPAYRREKEKFEAHAWVERDGTALNEPDEPHHHYAAFDVSLCASPPEET